MCKRIIRIMPAMIGSLVTLWLIACGGQDTQSVQPQSFYHPGDAAVAPVVPGAENSPNGRGGILPPPEANVPTVGEIAQPIPEGRSRGPNPDAPDRPVVVEDTQPPISEAVRESVMGTTRPVELPPAIAPSTQPAGTINSSDQSPRWIELGGLVAEVNGVPIYASKILHLNALAFQKEAHNMDLEQFRRFVIATVQSSIREQRDTELLVAAAKRTLNNDDLTLADRLTVMWRQRQITDAGGSEELATRRAAANGQSFPELVEDKHKQILVELHEERTMENQVVITVDDMRKYYSENANKLFTTHAACTFYLLQIDPATLAQPGDTREATRQRALDRVKDVRARVLKGEDFAALCQQYSAVKDQFKDYGHLPMKDLDAELWRVPIGQISDAVEDQGKFYLLRVDSRKDDKVASFDDAATQDKIHLTLEVAQLNKLKDAEIAKLLKNAITKEDSAMMQNCIDMVMENYPIWRSRKAPAHE